MTDGSSSTHAVLDYWSCRSVASHSLFLSEAMGVALFGRCGPCECLRHNAPQPLCSSGLGSVRTVFVFTVRQVPQLRFGVRVFPQSLLADSAGTARTVCQEPSGLTAYNISAYSMPCRLGWHRSDGPRCAVRRAKGIGCTMRKACIECYRPWGRLQHRTTRCNTLQ